jgi:pSer/pThr/pTyr-binding forkhead associated (FHA) protein
MIAQLIPADGSKTVTLYRDITVVGRDGDICDLVITHKSVSKLHSVLVKSDGLLFVRDLGSTNGTKVNGQKITRGALLPGDMIAFAGAKFKIFLGPGEPDPPEGPKTESIPTSSSKKMQASRSRKVPTPRATEKSPGVDRTVKSERLPKELAESNSDVRLLSPEELEDMD